VSRPASSVILYAVAFAERNRHWPHRLDSTVPRIRPEVTVERIAEEQGGCCGILIFAYGPFLDL
jgi:hypothetical protein